MLLLYHQHGLIARRVRYSYRGKHSFVMFSIYNIPSLLTILGSLKQVSKIIFFLSLTQLLVYNFNSF